MAFIISFILALILSYIYYRKTTPNITFQKKLFLIILRTITYFVLFLLIYSPIYSKLHKIKSYENVIFLNDISKSIGLKKIQTQNLLCDSLKNSFLQKEYSIKNLNFADGLKGKKNNTLLLKTLSQLKRKKYFKQTKAIILNSDGNFHDNNLTALQNFSVPIYPALRVQKSIQPDIAIDTIKINNEAFLNEKTPLNIKIKSLHFSGKANAVIEYNSHKIKKSLFLDSLKINNLNLYLKFTKTGIGKISVNIIPDNLKNEKNYYNNQEIKNVIVKNNKNKLVVISDKLNWDASFIHKSISAEKRWKSEFYLFRNVKFRSGKNPAFLSKILKNTNLLVIVQNDKINFNKNQIKLIDNFVKNGGGLLFQGKFNSELKDILPIKKFYPYKNTDIMTFSPEMEDFSIYSNMENADIPPVSYWILKPQFGAKVLARANNYPTIIFSEYSNGKILYLNCLNLWKWELSGKNQQYFDFMNHTIKWLGSKKSKLFEVDLSKYDYDLNENIVVKLHAVDKNFNPRKNVEAKIRVFDSKKNSVFSDFFIKQNNDWQVTIPQLPKGSYHFEVTDSKTGIRSKGDFVVTDNNLEMKDINWNTSALNYIATITDGKILGKNSDLKLDKAQIFEKTFIREIYLYKKWYFFLIFILSFSLELFIRKRNGLL